MITICSDLNDDQSSEFGTHCLYFSWHSTKIDISKVDFFSSIKKLMAKEFLEVCYVLTIIMDTTVFHFGLGVSSSKAIALLIYLMLFTINLAYKDHSWTLLLALENL